MLGGSWQWQDLVRMFWVPGMCALGALVWAAWRMEIYPCHRLVRWALLPAIAAGLLLVPDGAAPHRLFVPTVYCVLIVANAMLAAAALRDWLTISRLPRLVVDREYQRTASLRQTHRMKVMISNLGSTRLRAQVRDGIPDEFVASPAELMFELEPGNRVHLRYGLRSNRRGAFRWERIHLRTESRWGFWQRYWTVDAPVELNVYPDMRQLAEYDLLARTNRLNLMGLRRHRHVGQDHDFERLRDFTRDDNYRHIDWRSTARRNRLTVKDFQSNQSQQILFLIDCGRMMTNQAAGISLLDHALNSMLMLSYIALRRGDSVGLICFSNAIHCFVPPRGGPGHMNRLLHASFDRFPQMVESRYDDAFMHVATHCRRRALVILITNVIDQVNASQIQQYLAAVAGRHLPLGVLLRDRPLFRPLELRPGEMIDDVFLAAAAAGILQWRHQVLSDLQRQGVLALDVFPEELTAPLINRYLNIKARGLL